MDAMLKKLRSYADVGSDDADWFVSLPHRILKVEARREIVRAGDIVSNVFIVESGWAIRFRLLDDGRRQIVNFMLPGDCFDLQAVMHAAADHAVASVTPMRLRVTTSHRFLEAVGSNARMAAAFWWSAIQEESILREQIVRIGRRTARERIAHLMLELHRRLTLAGVARDETMSLPITRDMIADALGLSPIHVSRTLSRLRAEGLLDATRNRACILDREGLAEAADFDPAYLRAGAIPRFVAPDRPSNVA